MEGDARPVPSSGANRRKFLVRLRGGGAGRPQWVFEGARLLTRSSLTRPSAFSSDAYASIKTSSVNYSVGAGTRRLDRVVGAISDGTYDVPNAGPLARVQYIIFEQADGNARTNADASSKFDVAWSLRPPHHVATGLWQLHSQGIAHQDLKPSNILTFGKRSSKVADLGRASAKGTTAPHNSYPVAGDPRIMRHPNCFTTTLTRTGIGAAWRATLTFLGAW